jgi:hypothetical protein
VLDAILRLFAEPCPLQKILKAGARVTFNRTLFYMLVPLLLNTAETEIIAEDAFSARES